MHNPQPDCLIEAEELASALEQQQRLVILDTRFSLMDKTAGYQAWQQAHIPGAVYAHLDDQLSSPVISGVTGRHPLPNPEQLARLLGTWGIDQETPVVIYDHGGAAMAAARAWWLLRWLGHSKVRVLHEGMSGWLKRELPLSSELAAVEPKPFAASEQTVMLAEADEIAASLDNGSIRLLDARGPARFRGEEEPIDPVAGHIPGAVCVPFTDCYDADGRFLSATALKQLFGEAIAGAEDIVCYCGSGVTACNLQLAMAVAGLPEARLYAGSWSHWITDLSRPVATG
ncbi:sulfurtransferase [Endozoicomonadaceae bacterium StTr2]